MNKSYINIITILILILSSFYAFGQENPKQKNKIQDNPPEKLELLIEEIRREVKVANAEITKATIVYDEKNKKIKSDISLRSKLITNKEGEFSIEIPPAQFEKFSTNSSFELIIKINPPKNFNGQYSDNSVSIKLLQRNGPNYNLILLWIPESTKTNKGTFAVSSKAQT